MCVHTHRPIFPLAAQIAAKPVKKGSRPQAFGICSPWAREGHANHFIVGSGLFYFFFFSSFSLSLSLDQEPTLRQCCCRHEKAGPSVQMLPREAEVPTPSRKRGLTEPGRGLRKWQQGWTPAATDPGMMGEEKRRGGPRRGGEASILREKGGPRWGDFIVRLCLHPKPNESNDLVYCRSPEWTAEGEGGGMGRGGLILLLILPFTISSSSFFFFPPRIVAKIKE